MSSLLSSPVTQKEKVGYEGIRVILLTYLVEKVLVWISPLEDLMPREWVTQNQFFDEEKVRRLQALGLKEFPETVILNHVVQNFNRHHFVLET